jgi:hypothetical protein
MNGLRGFRFLENALMASEPGRKPTADDFRPHQRRAVTTQVNPTVTRYDLTRYDPELVERSRAGSARPGRLYRNYDQSSR